MAKRNKNESNLSTTWQRPTPSFAYKPFSIGTEIKRIAQEKNISPIELEKRIGLTHRNIYRIFKAKHMAIPMMFRMSEALGVNLLLEYHPNVPPVADPLKEENARLTKENTELKRQISELKQLVDENIALKAKLEVLLEVMKGK